MQPEGSYMELGGRGVEIRGRDGVLAASVVELLGAMGRVAQRRIRE
jgi:hypothetical protein